MQGIIGKIIGADPVALRDGPNRAALRDQAGRHNTWAALILAVAAVGDHAGSMVRAFHKLGLVESVEMVEPGAKITGKMLGVSGPDRSVDL